MEGSVGPMPRREEIVVSALSDTSAGVQAVPARGACPLSTTLLSLVMKPYDQTRQCLPGLPSPRPGPRMSRFPTQSHGS